MKNKPILTSTYKIRATILANLYTVKEHSVIPDLYVLNCEDSITELADNLFSQNYSYVENIHCTKKCQKLRSKKYTSYRIPTSFLRGTDRKGVFTPEKVEDLLSRVYAEIETIPCKTPNCQGTIETFHELG